MNTVTASIFFWSRKLANNASLCHKKNPDFSCQHLHPSATKTNVVILEMIITIIKTQQTVPTHKTSVCS